MANTFETTSGLAPTTISGLAPAENIGGGSGPARAGNNASGHAHVGEDTPPRHGNETAIHEADSVPVRSLRAVPSILPEDAGTLQRELSNTPLKADKPPYA